MKDDYDKSIKLLCATCGSGDFFDEDKLTGEITCKKCNRIYHGGYDEIVSLNQQVIDSELDLIDEEILKDLQNDLNDILRKTIIKIK